MKFLKHLFSTLVILSVFFETEKTFSFSEEFIPTPELYNELIAEEILSKDITYNDWLEIIEISKKLEEGFSNNEDFEELILTPFSSGFGRSGGSGLLVKGDILITNGTNLSGLYGHAGIVVGSNQILHIEGPKHRPSIITLSLWHSKYTNRSSSSETIVYRHSKTTMCWRLDKSYVWTKR